MCNLAQFRKENPLQICRTRLELPEKQALQNAGKLSIGFVPTMGALHEGHASLIRQAKLQCSFVVASIFVNPLQFNNPEDLRSYPRTPSEDLQLLEANGCDLVFIPDNPDEVFMPTNNLFYDGGWQATILEGAFRPGHFQGVFRVVHQLFDLVQPDKAFFGEKDFQQFFLLREMSRQLFSHIEIVRCPTQREPDGLAMSSRNKRLNPEERKDATSIFKALQELSQAPTGSPFSALEQQFNSIIEAVPSLSCEYLALINENTFELEVTLKHNGNQRFLTAVYCNKVRLIDTLNIPPS